MDDSIKITGHIEEFIDGELVNSRSNIIHPDIQNMLGTALHNDIDIGLGSGSTSLFSNQNVRNLTGNREIENDGIVLQDGNYSSGRFFTMETVEENLDYNNNGVQWRGIQSASESRSVTGLAIGHQLVNDVASDIFFTTFAIVDKTDSPIPLSQNQVYEVTWGIDIF